MLSKTIIILIYLQIVYSATCNTYVNAISNITDCVNSVCTVEYSTLVTGTLATGFSSCIIFGQIKADNNVTLLPEKRFDLTVMKAGFEIPLDLQYVTGDITVTYDSYCSCNIISGVSDCTNMGFSNSPILTMCKISKQFTDTCLIHKTYSFAQLIGLDVEPRFKLFLARNFIPTISLHYTYNNISNGIEWNGITPNSIPINSEISFDLLSSVSETNIKYPKYMVLDLEEPYDLYDGTTFNMPGEFSTDKFGAIYWLPDGTYQYKLNNFEPKLTSTLIKCDKDNSRSTLTLNYPRIDTYLENKRLLNDSLRNMYKSIVYYDENTFASNDFWSSNTKNPSHLQHNHAVYAKSGNANYIRNYIEVLDQNLFGHKLGVLNNVGYLDEVQLTSNKLFQILDCDYTPFNILWDNNGWSWSKNGSSFSTTNGSYIDWEGICRYNTFGFNLPQYVPIHTDVHHLFISYNTPGSFTYRVYGKFPGISFSNQLCPEIQNVYDDYVNHYIVMTARSTCGSGEVMVMSNNSLSHGSQAIILTATFTQFKIPRLANISDTVSVGLCSLDNCKYSNLKVSNFKYVPPISQIDTNGNEVPAPGGETTSIFGSFSDFSDQVKDLFSWKLGGWKSILFKIIMYIIIAIAIIIVIIILKYLFMYLLRRFFTKSPTRKVKYI